MISEKRSLRQRVLGIGSSDRFVSVTTWCATIVAVMQLLFVWLHVLIIINLHSTSLAILFAVTFSGVHLVPEQATH